VITGKTLIQATVRDISEEKKNEELRRNEERFRSIFKSSSDGMVLADPRTRRFHMANKAWCKMLGYRENEVTKLGLADVHPKQSLSFVIKQFDLLVRKKIGIAKEIPVIRKDGRLLYADITTGNMQLENKFYMLETFRDVTERKLATDALKSSRSQLKNLSDSIGGAMIYQIYAADAKSREITYISNRCREFYGASPEQIMKNPQLMYGKVYPEDVEKLVKGEAQALAKAKQLKIELRMLNPDGSIRWSYFISTPHKLGNGITLWDGIEFDITERKKIEEKLGESEERFRSLVSATSQIIWRTNPKGEMHIEQPDWARFTGQSKKEYMGSGWGKAIHPDDLERVAKVWANAVKTRSVVSAEYRLRKANGQYAYIISRGVPVLNKDGSVREWIGTINDITARKETENALRESEERFRRIFEEGQIGVSMLGLDGHFLRANQKLCQILGYSEKELNRLRFADITHPEERARDAAKPIELVEGKISHYDVEKRYIRKDGKIIWCAIHVSMVRDQNGKPLYFITITDDITKRKENEIELKKTSEIVKNSIEPMSLVDFGKTNLLKYVNPAWEKLFGYKRSEVVNRKQSLLLETIRGQADLNQEFTKLIKNKKPFIRELILKKKNGEQIYAEVFVQPIFDERGQLLIWANNIRDITVRKRIEIELERYRHHLEDLVKRRTAELSRQTTFLDSIVENIPNMIFVKDAKELRFERFNKAGEKLLGMKRKNLYGKNDYDFFPKAQADFFTSKDRAVLKSKKLFDISEEPIDTKHGKRFLHTKKIPILDKDGKPVYLLGISEDITEQKEARQKLIEAEHKAQEYLDIAPAITVALDRNGRVTTISSVGAALLGYPKGKIIGKPWFDTFVPASIQENVKKVFRQLMLGNVEPVRHYENPIVIYGGKQRLIEWYNTLLRDNKGHIVGTLSSGQDITEKKKTELELAESEKFLGSVLENVPYLVFVKRTPDFRWVMANKAMSEFMQLPKEKILGKTNYQLFPKEQAEFFQSKDQESIASLSIVHIDEEVIRTSSGDKLIRLSKIPIVGEKGEVKYVMGIGEDITESKDVEMMKARFISSVSHELRTPITPIRAQTQRMLDKELPPEEKKEGLEIILRNTIRLDRLIQDILEINRIRAGRLQVYFKKEDLNSIVQTVLTDMESLIKVKDTKIYFSPGKLPKLMVDKDRIMEIVINLVDNAIKYGHKKIWIKTELKGREVLVSVKDNGIGISQEHLKMVFIPFFRAQEPGTSGVEGTGLGLSIAKGIVESHKGRIWMQSKKGKGTTVYFALPVKFK
jgi:PAS domain S-box-containing protein